MPTPLPPAPTLRGAGEWLPPFLSPAALAAREPPRVVGDGEKACGTDLLGEIGDESIDLPMLVLCTVCFQRGRAPFSESNKNEREWRKGKRWEGGKERSDGNNSPLKSLLKFSEVQVLEYVLRCHALFCEWTYKNQPSVDGLIYSYFSSFFGILLKYFELFDVSETCERSEK